MTKLISSSMLNQSVSLKVAMNKLLVSLLNTELMTFTNFSQKDNDDEVPMGMKISLILNLQVSSETQRLESF